MVRTLGLQLQPFDYASHTDDVGIEWRKWLKSFETMVRASRIENDEWKNDLLLHFAGSSVQQLVDTLPELPESNMRGPLVNVECYTPNMTSYEEVVTKLNSFFLPKENATYERHLLRQMKQVSGESIDAFTVRLRVQAERCGFGDKVEENVKDQIIQNCQSAILRRDLLKQGDASLKDVLAVAKIFETVAQQEKSFAGTVQPNPPVNEINKIEASSSQGKRNFLDTVERTECYRCGYFGHMARDDKCPAKGKSCNKCGNRDHFAKKCRTRKQPFYSKDKREKDHTDKTLERREHTDKVPSTVQHINNENTEYVFNVTTSDGNDEMLCEIGGVTVAVVIDSGSKYNILSKSIWEKMKTSKVIVSNQRQEVSKVFRAYGGQALPLLGAFTATIRFGKQENLADFYVVQGSGKLLIGRDTATAMGVLNINSSVNGIDIEKGSATLGTIKDIVIDIPIKIDVIPVAQPYRRIPVALEKKVDQKIDELLVQGVIEKVNEPARWVSPVVVVPKGDDVRVCVEMRRANEAIERENHPLPIIEDFLLHMGKARLDVKNAFHQVG
ncbi:uncharacterized protein LOC131687412 [Topomyia yanbarensis]|uniref:uncharacterized protein LOC131687412 n=1 Tax=Topomyia yanbarensis TaxID=2498891 RepID=UPI00273B6E84|nr:uncharacterized protein LOC131687412 [Topomyia yanbarensis]